MDDLESIKEAIRTIAEVVESLCAKVDWHDEQLDRMNTSKVYERLDGIEGDLGTMVGGLNDIIDGRRKREHSTMFRENHPEFGKYENVGKKMGIDVYGTAADSTFGLEDEEANGRIAEMLAELSGKFDDIIEALEKNAHESSETPQEEAVEEKALGKEGEESGESGPKNKVIEIARLMKGTGVGGMKTAREA